MINVKIVGDYEWKPSYTTSVPAPLFAEQFGVLQTQVQGKVSPRALVDFARPQTAALHPLFEWDDQLAAEEYRVHQARQAMSHLVVTVQSNTAISPIPVTIRAIVNLRDDDEQGYLSVVNSLNDDDIYRQLLVNSLRDAYQFWQKFQTVNEADHLLRSIRRYLEQHSDVAIEAGLKVADLYDATLLDNQRILPMRAA